MIVKYAYSENFLVYGIKPTNGFPTVSGMCMIIIVCHWIYVQFTNRAITWYYMQKLGRLLPGSLKFISTRELYWHSCNTIPTMGTRQYPPVYSSAKVVCWLHDCHLKLSVCSDIHDYKGACILYPLSYILKLMIKSSTLKYCSLYGY